MSQEANPTVSATARSASCYAAFRDERDGETHLAIDVEGRPSATHTFAGLPDHWVVERDVDGEPLALHPAVRAGHWRNAEFVPLERLLVPSLDG